MDLDNYESQSQGDQQQQMQCDPAYPANGSVDATFGSIPRSIELPMATAIPLPAPAPRNQPDMPKNQHAATNSADLEIDSLLLQKFSCLGTTDHEDLINQFRGLMNNQMDKEKAIFFLEMSNWNLQTAVGCYLDFCNCQTATPSMKIVQQSQPSEFQMAWRLQNNGTEYWPSGCYLMSANQTRRVELPVIKPGETCDILAELPSSYPTIMWHVCTPDGNYFGETIWLIPPETPAEVDKKWSDLNTPEINIVISVNME